jgi:response regulator RpfG family c-di-GMP phosphodiesterase
MLGCLSPAALEVLAARAVPRDFVAGDLVFAEGDHGESLHVVRSGTVQVLRRSSPGLVLDELGPGAVFGELAVLNGTPRTASIVATTYVQTVELHAADLEQVLDAHPRDARRMLGVLARSLTLAKEAVARQNQVLEATVRARTAELRESQAEVVRRLGHAAESRDGETGAHIVRMSRVAHLLALACGLDPHDAEMLLHAAPMHDVGKIGIPDAILLKPGELDPDEWETMKRHAVIGAELLAGSHSPVVQLGETIALTHHERYDGTGYPAGLRGEEIPFVARITAVCDVFDALISKRPYKRPWSHEAALAEIQAQSGRHFDPVVVEAFTRIYPEVLEIVRAVGHDGETSTR